MKERLVRIAKWNQRYLGAVLLAIAYLGVIGPTSLFLKLGRFAGWRRESEGGWQKLEGREISLESLREQS